MYRFIVFRIQSSDNRVYQRLSFHTEKVYFYDMQKDHLREPFELVLKEVPDECPRGAHSHTFFELVYVVSGTGKQCINEVEVSYKPGHLFVVAPNDAHIFKIETPTQFFFIRLNTSFISGAKAGNKLSERLETILENARHEPGCILKTEDDKTAARHLIQILITEHLKKDEFHKDLITSLVNTLLILVARNIHERFPETVSESTDQKLIDILEYIQSNIYSPDKLKADEIGKHVGLSESYLSNFFRKHARESMQQYILHYKLKLIENRLLHSNMRINEVADEFGFTDKSHLNRIFKKHRGMNPSSYRKQHQGV